MQVVYIGPEDEVEIAVGFDSIVAVRGEPVEVPYYIANGQPPRDDWPGTSGLLAQEELWAAAGGAPPPSPPPPAPDSDDDDDDPEDDR